MTIPHIISGCHFTVKLLSTQDTRAQFYPCSFSTTTYLSPYVSYQPSMSELHYASCTPHAITWAAQTLDVKCYCGICPLKPTQKSELSFRQTEPYIAKSTSLCMFAQLSKRPRLIYSTSSCGSFLTCPVISIKDVTVIDSKSRSNNSSLF